MLTFSECTDYPLIRAIITNPRIYDHVTDDFSAPREEYQPIVHPEVFYVIVGDPDIRGLWIFQKHSPVLYEIHTCLRPEAWGKFAVQAAAGLATWLWDHHPQCQCVITKVPEYNRLALAFAKRAGMKECGRLPRSYQKHGKIMDTTILCATRPQEAKPCQ